ncbi:glycosyltransferase [Aureococcus anophagefferens]|nr:glycosyltransferase [Aureococcus anophagefferens]
MSDPCAFGDRHCTLPPPQKLPCVWVGPKDGKWVKVVDAEDVDSSAPVPCPPAGAPGDHDASIVFVAIAAFRDSLCATTLEGLFGRASTRRPRAAVQQNKPEDDDCYEAYCAKARASRGLGDDAPCPYGDHISVKRFSSDEAKGPTWARAQDADMLPDDAEFCLRTDSHMAFANDWDTKQIAQWYGARNEYAVLSTYVADANQINEDGSEKNINNVWEVPHLCSILWQDGHVRNMQAKAARLLEKPKLTTLWAAGLSFSRCHAERAVPYDPHTPYIFWGEEFSRTARFFTNGYDIYTPPRTIVAHDYKHTQGDPSHFKWNGKGGPRLNQNKTIVAQRDAANRRIWTLLGMPGGDPDPAARRRLGAYGLGDKRSLDDLVAFTGINLYNRTIGPNRCGNIDWSWEDRLPGRVGSSRDLAAERFVEREFVSFEQMAAQRAIKSVMHHKHPRGADAAPAHTADNAPIPPTTVLLGLLGLWTAVKALNVIFRGKSKRQALGLPSPRSSETYF